MIKITPNELTSKHVDHSRHHLFFKIMFVIVCLPLIILIGMNMLPQFNHKIIEYTLTTALFHIPVVLLVFVISAFNGKNALFAAAKGFISGVVICLSLFVVALFIIELFLKNI